MSDKSISLVRRYFDEHSDEYVDNCLNNSVSLYKKKNAFLNVHVQYDPSAVLEVLDIGAGGGIWADLFLDDYPRARLFCLDVSSLMLRKCRPKPGKYFVVGDGMNPPFPNSRFDLINLDALMHHLVDHSGYLATILKIIKFLRSLKTLLNQQGRVIVSEIYHESILRDEMVSRLLFFVSTLNLPNFLRSPLRTLVRTQGVGVCFLTRRQWAWVIAQSGYRIEGSKDLRWNIPFLGRLFGFKASGDLFLLLSPM